MKRTTAVMNTALALAALLLSSTDAEAHSETVAQTTSPSVAATVHLQPGETWSYHVEDVDWPLLWVGKSITALDHMAHFTVSESVMGDIHLEPGEMFHHSIGSMTPYQDAEGFTNLGDVAQSLAGVVELPAIPAFDFNDPVDPEDTGHVFIDPQAPSPKGRFDTHKWLENVDDSANWWGYESTTIFEPIGLDAGMSWYGNSHHENGTFTGYWLEITNAGDAEIWLDVQVQSEVPEPSTVTWLALAGLAFVARRHR